MTQDTETPVTRECLVFFLLQQVIDAYYFSAVMSFNQLIASALDLITDLLYWTNFKEPISWSTC